MIRTATTQASKIQYVEEHGPEPIKFQGPLTAELVDRDWDVEDSEARCAAAEEQLGKGADDDEWYSQHAMWFVNASARSAVLIVLRPKHDEVIVR